MIEVERMGEVVKVRLSSAFLGRPLYHTAAYWVDGLLIDSGAPRMAKELLKVAEELGVRWVVNTHSHEDHIGGNALLQNRLGAEIGAHPQAVPILADPGRLRLQPYRRLMWGSPAPSQGRPVGETVRTERYTFRVILTPGHSEDHMALYEPEEGWLFSGDAYVGGRDRTLRADNDVYTIIASLKTLAALPATRLFQGSGTVRHDPQEAMREKIEYLETLGARVWQLYEAGFTPKEIRDRLLGREMAMTYLTLGHFSGFNLVRSYLKGVSGPELGEEAR